MGKFQETWATQSEIGKKFGISAVAVGKILLENGLRDSNSKLPTQKALSENWYVETPLKDGTPHYMWDIKKIEGLLISAGINPREKHEIFTCVLIKKIKASNRLLDRGDDRLGFNSLEEAFMKVPEDLKVKVIENLTAEGYGCFVKYLMGSDT